MAVIHHAFDETMRQVLLKYGVSETGAWQFMQEQTVTDANDRHALRVLMWRFCQFLTPRDVLPQYDYSKMPSGGRSIRGRRP